MDIKLEHSEDKQKVILYLDGDFDGDAVKDFEKAYESCQPAPKVYVLDMRRVSYIDSTALGILLRLRDYAQEREADVHICRMNDVVVEIFRILNFHKIFKPEYSRDSYLVEWVAKKIKKE